MLLCEDTAVITDTP